jgi:hypothetical protein
VTTDNGIFEATGSRDHGSHIRGTFDIREAADSSVVLAGTLCMDTTCNGYAR